MPIVLGNASIYGGEEELEALICERPQLLLDDADACDRGRKVALVGRQVQLPSAGKLDALFITDDGVPIAVEVKLAKNAQSRREVMAQAIDYASDLTSLTVDELDDLVQGALEGAVYQLTDETNGQFDDIWKRVGTNLRAAKARIILVLDEVNQGLERIFHFLARSSMLDIHVVTVKSYLSEAGRIVVSRRCVSPMFEEQQPNSRATGPRRRPRGIPEEALITVLTESNPKRPGGASFERYKLYSGMSVRDFLRAGGPPASEKARRQRFCLRSDSALTPS